MKELSTEEKAQAYDEALEKSKRLYEQGTITESLCYVFPELKENEDESIRNEIIEYLKGERDAFPRESDDFQTWIAWLEKQGDEPIDKIVKRAMTEKQRVLITESDGEANIGWDTRSLKDARRLLECGLQYINTEFEKQGNANKEYWRGYREGKKEILDKYSELEKQGEQKPADNVEPKFKVKYGGGEYNVLEVRDIAGVTFYGIEDEPNHIDYVKAENCKIIGSYVIKENGSLYPTKIAVFSEQKPAWSEEDEKCVKKLLTGLRRSVFLMLLKVKNPARESIKWLKSLKQRIGG